MQQLSVAISQSREEVWKEPIYRNVWALLHEFGDAEIASLIAPRTLIVEASQGVEIDGPPPVRDGRSGAAPGKVDHTITGIGESGI